MADPYHDHGLFYIDSSILDFIQSLFFDLDFGGDAIVDDYLRRVRFLIQETVEAQLGINRWYQTLHPEAEIHQVYATVQQGLISRSSPVSQPAAATEVPPVPSAGDLITTSFFLIFKQEGASEEDICRLPKFKFRRTGESEKNGEIPRSGGIMTECGDSHNEVVLTSEDAECCICLSAYDDGVELRQLPCGHHFHCACLDKWLHINATCPLCKYNIIKSCNSSREEV